MPDNVQQALDEIVLWLDDNLANEEDAPFERRAKLIEMALEKAMALSVPTPPSVPTVSADLAAAIVAVEQYGCGCDLRAGWACQIHDKVRELLKLIVVEREAAHKAGLAEAAKHRPRVFHEAAGYLIRCDCGWKSGAVKCEDDSLLFVQWSNHILELKAALRATPAAPEEPRT